MPETNTQRLARINARAKDLDACLNQLEEACDSATLAGRQMDELDLVSPDQRAEYIAALETLMLYRAKVGDALIGDSHVRQAITAHVMARFTTTT